MATRLENCGGAAAFRLRLGIQDLDEQCFSSEAFNDEPRMDFPTLNEKHSRAAARCIVGGMVAAILGLTAGTAVAQTPIFVSHQHRSGRIHAS